MKSFLLACVAIGAISVGAKVALESLQLSSAAVYSADDSVRLD